MWHTCGSQGQILASKAQMVRAEAPEPVGAKGGIPAVARAMASCKSNPPKAYDSLKAYESSP